jgi:flagellar basal-body rod modification protein FlgD
LKLKVKSSTEEEMAASITGIWNHTAQAPATASTRTMSSDATSSDSGSAGSTSANISANDFLTLLVTEMKNQDPTANTDPNEYINQLVQVNSLEQLISINQTLTTDASSNTASSGTNPKKDVSIATAPVTTNVAPGTASASGNLTIPPINPAAQRVAQAIGLPANRQ